MTEREAQYGRLLFGPVFLGWVQLVGFFALLGHSVSEDWPRPLVAFLALCFVTMALCQRENLRQLAALREPPDAGA